MRKLIIATAILVGIASPANAAFMEGNTLYKFCEATDSTSQAMCWGYIDGVADMMELSDATAVPKKPECVPQGVHSQQVRDVVVQYLRDNPVSRSYNADSVAYVAIRKAWNCP